MVAGDRHGIGENVVDIASARQRETAATHFVDAAESPPSKLFLSLQATWQAFQSLRMLDSMKNPSCFAMVIFLKPS